MVFFLSICSLQGLVLIVIKPYNSITINGTKYIWVEICLVNTVEAHSNLTKLSELK